MKKHQKGFTLTELITVMAFVAWFIIVCFLGYAAIYAIGKYLFHWWG